MDGIGFINNAIDSEKTVLDSLTKAYQDPDFLNSQEAQLIRIQCEFLATKKRLKEQNIHNTIIFFGSGSPGLLSFAKK